MWDFWADWLRTLNSDTRREARRWRASTSRCRCRARSGTRRPTYIPIVCWRDQAEFAAKWLAKGRQIVVEGRLSTRKYQGADGKTHKVVEVIASRLYFADSNNREAGGGDYGGQDFA